MDSIEFKEIPGFDGRYLLGSNGEVYRTRDKAGAVLPVPIIMKKDITNKGYYRISLYNKSMTSKRKYIRHSVHRLVGLLFVENKNPSKFKIINHKNGIRNDNRSSNIEWCDNSHNQLHAFRVTKTQKPIIGTEAWNSKYTESDILLMRALHKSGVTQKEIGKMFGSHQAYISEVILRKCWRHI